MRHVRGCAIPLAFLPDETAAVASYRAAIVWQRSRLDGAPGYALTLAVENGTVSGGDSTPLVLAPARAGEAMRLRITALTGETPLTPFAADTLLSPQAGDDERSRQALRFLAYREKSSPDRGASTHIRPRRAVDAAVMPALATDAIEAAWRPCWREGDQGERAEEDIGESRSCSCQGGRQRRRADPDYPCSTTI